MSKNGEKLHLQSVLSYGLVSIVITLFNKSVLSSYKYDCTMFLTFLQVRSNLRVARGGVLCSAPPARRSACPPASLASLPTVPPSSLLLWSP